ncbi:MAG TPA: hypothetical protein VHM64_07175 [Candidatus Binatia bacterium]|nr:hypothetical protein [Candidatus Binatia bacterium]
MLRAAQVLRAGELASEKITDETKKRELRLSARRIQVMSPIAALVLSVIGLWLARMF